MSDYLYLTTEDGLAISGYMGLEVRDAGLLASALARPAATAFGDDLYEGFERKCAALIEGINRNHPLVDGNKRLSWVCAVNFADLNGRDLVAEQDEIFRTIMAVAAGELSLDQIEHWISEVRTAGRN
jgi:death-on-curing protein